MTTLERLISEIPTCRIGRHVEASDVAAIIEFGHIHLHNAFADVPSHGKIGTVMEPDGTVHHVQVRADSGNHFQNYLGCSTCHPHFCAAQVAAFIVDLARWLESRDQTARCPGCGQEIPIPFDGRPMPFTKSEGEKGL